MVCASLQELEWCGSKMAERKTFKWRLCQALQLTSLFTLQCLCICVCERDTEKLKFTLMSVRCTLFNLIYRCEPLLKRQWWEFWEFERLFRKERPLATSLPTRKGLLVKVEASIARRWRHCCWWVLSHPQERVTLCWWRNSRIKRNRWHKAGSTLVPLA